MKISNLLLALGLFLVVDTVYAMELSPCLYNSDDYQFFKQELESKIANHSEARDAFREDFRTCLLQTINQSDVVTESFYMPTNDLDFILSGGAAYCSTNGGRGRAHITFEIEGFGSRPGYYHLRMHKESGNMFPGFMRTYSGPIINHVFVDIDPSEGIVFESPLQGDYFGENYESKFRFICY